MPDAMERNNEKHTYKAFCKRVCLCECYERMVDQMITCLLPIYFMEGKIER